MDIFTGLHPDLVEKIKRILLAMSALGFPMKPYQGLRTVAQQQAFYAQGRTRPGRIITHCDGVRKKSRHQLSQDGTGHAMDCCFEGPDPFGETQPWKVYGEMGKALKLVWGGDFRSLIDRPHLELR